MHSRFPRTLDNDTPKPLAEETENLTQSRLPPSSLGPTTMEDKSRHLLVYVGQGRKGAKVKTD